MRFRDAGKLFCQYAVPQMTGLLFNSVYLLVDGIFIGRLLGRNSLAAAGIAVPLTELLIAVSMAVAAGSGALISSQLARHRSEEANGTFHTAVLALGMISVIVLLITKGFAGWICRALGATEEIARDAQVYLRTVMAGSPFQLFSFLLGGMARNDRTPKLAMAAMTIGALSNIVLDWVFMGPLGMGIFGAALATAIGPVIACGILLPHFLKGKGELSFTGTWRMYRPGRILLSGIPSFVLEFTIGMITFLMNRAMVDHGYGEVGLAAYLLIGYVLLIWLTLYLGMAEGLQPLFSRFAGTGDMNSQRTLLFFAATVFPIVGLICYALVLFGAKAFMGIFAPEDPVLVQFAADRCPAYFSGFVFAGWGILMISYWQAVGEVRKALIVSVARAVLFPLCFIILLPAALGTEAIWTAHSAAEAAAALLCAILIRRKPRHDRSAGQNGA